MDMLMFIDVYLKVNQYVVKTFLKRFFEKVMELSSNQ